MPKAVKVVEFSNEERATFSEAVKAAKAKKVGDDITALIKDALEGAALVAKDKQPNPETLALAKEGVDRTRVLIEALPGDLGADFNHELRGVSELLEAALEMVDAA